MNSFINYIGETSSNLATTYNLDLSSFFLIYLVSFVPFYLGYFLIIYGTTRHLQWRDIFSLKLRHKLHWSSQSGWGLVVHLFGRVMPYAYIVIFARNVPFWLYFVVVAFLLFSTWYLLNKIFLFKKDTREHQDVSVVRVESVSDSSERALLWKIYNHTFEKVNKISPCRQSFDEDHFMEALVDVTIQKYILRSDSTGIIGIALISNDFKNAPWISSDYFKAHFSEAFENHLIYYFLGIAIQENLRSRRYSLLLIERIIDDIPHNAIMGFDHSRNINPLLHHFTKVVRQARFITRTHIDRQHYHIVQRK